MSNDDDSEVTEIELNSELMDQFTEEIEKAINKTCEKNPDIDPRLELLVTLGLIGSQVSQDSGYTKKDFLDLMSDLFDDIELATKEEENSELDVETPWFANKKGTQFNVN